MDIRINCQCIEDLPKLSWIATLNEDDLSLTVIHGKSVEIHDQWIVEGVWDDDFAQGNFHHSANFFGSGIRIDNDKIYFVPSSAMVDRLFYCYSKNQLIVANSLINLLAYTGAALDENHDYVRETTTIFEGEKKYQKEYRIIHPEIKCFYQVFYENIVFADGKISFESRNKPLEKISSFDEYYERLTGILERIAHNYQSPLRQHRIEPFTTISSGYDATAVSALVKNIGVTTCFTSKKSNSWLPALFKSFSVDDGTPAAKALGMNIIYLDNCKNNISEDELYYLSTTYAKHGSQVCIREIIFHSMNKDIEHNCDVAIVFTGVHGDKIWDINTPDKFLVDDIIRNQTDQNLSEVRLKSGLINIPVPIILARFIKDIIKIGQSEEMKPWQMNNDYDRPVARRIAETAGVKRGTFAFKKKAAATWSYRYPYNKKLRKQYFQYLQKHHGISPCFVYLNHYLNQFQVIMQKALKFIGLRSQGYKQTAFWKEIDLTFFLWVWAANELKEKAVRILEVHRAKNYPPPTPPGIRRTRRASGGQEHKLKGKNRRFKEQG